VPDDEPLSVASGLRGQIGGLLVVEERGDLLAPAHLR
jgi:hypothetical protein